MKHQWQPAIDHWIPENQDISNMTSRGISYQYMPPVTDMYAGSEGEEEKMKVQVPGHGKIKLEDLRKIIADQLKVCETLLHSDAIKDMEALEQALHGPHMSGLVKILVNHVKALKSKVS